MRFMRRVLFAIISGLSLLLFFATVAIWIRSDFFRDTLMYAKTGGNLHTIQSLLGNLHIISQLDGGSSGGPLFWRTDRLSPDAIWNGGMSGYPVQIRKHLGFVFQSYTLDHYNLSGLFPGIITTHHRLIVIPYWSAALLFAILPTIWIWRFVKYGHRRKIGHCPKCNYDLRATPERCPECGWVPSGL